MIFHTFPILKLLGNGGFEDDVVGQGLTGKEKYVLAVPPYLDLFKLDEPVKEPVDIHAGAFETEQMRENFPDLVDTKIAETLVATNLSSEQVGQWANGNANDKYLTPYGYCGDPARYKFCHSDSFAFATHIARGIIKFLFE